METLTPLTHEEQVWAAAFDAAEQMCPRDIMIVEPMYCVACSHYCVAVHPLHIATHYAQCPACGVLGLVAEVEWRCP